MAKLNQVKSTLILIVSDASNCYYPAKRDHRNLESFHWKVTKCIIPHLRYKERLMYLNGLPLDFLVLSHLFIFILIGWRNILCIDYLEISTCDKVKQFFLSAWNKTGGSAL